MTLHCRNEQGDQGLQPLSADAVSCFPENDQSLAHGVVLNASPGPGLRPIHDRVTPQEPFHMLAMIPGNLGKLREDQPFLGSRRGTISSCNSIQ